VSFERIRFNIQIFDIEVFLLLFLGRWVFWFMGDVGHFECWFFCIEVKVGGHFVIEYFCAYDFVRSDGEELIFVGHVLLLYKFNQKMIITLIVSDSSKIIVIS